MRAIRGRGTKLTAAVLTLLVVGGCSQFINGFFDSGQPSPSAPSSDSAGKTPSLTPKPETPTEPTATPTEPTATPTETAATEGEAIEALAGLAIKGRAPKTGYDRDLFSDGWGSFAGCDWRNRILARDLVDLSYRDDCIVESGRLQDPYTGQRIDFFRGVQTSFMVQIDHVVAVSDAWQKGAQQLTSTQRYNFYNDPLNLLAVDGPTNSSKGDSDAASWLPPSKSYRCEYVARQIAVKAKYQLWVTRAESEAMFRVLESCPNQRLPG